MDFINPEVWYPDIWRTLKSLRDRSQLPHGLLISGPKGVGKKELVVLWLQWLFCEMHGELPCRKCVTCRKIEKHQAEWILFIDPEKERLRLSDAERAMEFLELKKTKAAQFVIINEADSLPTPAASVLLKVLEEPPSGTHFVLITKSPWRVLPTIRSRLMNIHIRAATSNCSLQNSKTPPWMIKISEGRPFWLDELKSARNEEIISIILELFRERHHRETQGLFQEKVADLVKPKEYLPVKLFWGYVILQELALHALNPKDSFLCNLNPLFEPIANLSPPIVDWLHDWVEVERRINQGFPPDSVFESFCFGGLKNDMD